MHIRVWLWLSLLGFVAATQWNVSAAGGSDSTCQPCASLKAAAENFARQYDSISIEPGTYLSSFQTSVAVANLTVFAQNPGVILTCDGVANYISIGFSASGFSMNGITISQCQMGLQTIASDTTISNCDFLNSEMAISAVGATNFVLKDSTVSGSIVITQTAPVNIQNSVAPLISNVTFSGNQNNENDPSRPASALFIHETPNARVVGCRFKGMIGGSALALVGDVGGAQLDQLQFTNNSSPLHASIYIYPTSTAQVNVTSSTFIGNSALGSSMAAGAAIYAAILVELYVKNCTFNSNRAYNGGAIYISTLGTVKESIFYNNSATDYGGCIYSELYVNVSSCSFDLCHADLLGGSMFLAPGASAVDSENSYTRSSASDGSVIFVSASSFTATSSNFSGIPGPYAAISTTSNAFVNTFYCNFFNNIGPSVGIAPQGSYSDTQSTFYNNVNSTSYADGAAVWLTGNSGTLTGSIFKNNTARRGGAVAALSGDFLCISCVFVNNRAISGGAVFFDQAAKTVAVTKSTFEENYAYTSGGALYFNRIAILTIFNSTFRNNLAEIGGAIDLESSNLTDTQNVYENNTSTGGSGGAIYTLQATVVSQGSSFYSNIAQQSGGGIFGESSDLAITSGHFTRCSAVSGGGIYAYYGMSTTTNCTFDSNSASTSQGGGVFVAQATYYESLSTFTNNYANNGGAIYIYTSNGTFTNSEFLSNRGVSDGQGGAVYIGDAIFQTFNNCNFTGNSAEGNQSFAGALYISSATGAVHLTACTLQNNIGQNKGGAIYASLVEIHVTRTTLSGNFAKMGGGAVYISTGGNLICNSCTMVNNTANQNGGALFTNNCLGTTISASTFGQNSALGFGGAMYAYGCPNLYFESSSFSGNSAVTAGGGIYAQLISNGLTFTNLTFTNNSGSSGGAIYTDSILVGSASNFTLNGADLAGGAIYTKFQGNLTTSNFATNKALFRGGAIYLEQSEIFLISASNFSQNSANEGGGGLMAQFVPEVILQNVQFIGNMAPGSLGGGLFVTSGVAVITDGSFSENTAHLGGGAYIAGSTLQMSRTVVKSNVAQLGGGMFIDTPSSGRISGATFTNNHANESGGALYIEAAFSIEDGTIGNNTALVGTGIYIGDPVAEQGLTLASVLLSNISPFMYCCESTPQSNFTNLLCSYPSCSQSCGNVASGCTCPVPAPKNCSCDSKHLLGVFCNIPDECFLKADECIGGCGYDISYNFECCHNGYNYTKVGNKCNDLDECQLDLDNCAPHATCNNLPGNFSCTCDSPLTGNGTYCTACNSTTCYPGVSCTTNDTKFECGTCPPGYSGNGVGLAGCADINECTPPNRKCDNHVDCQNGVGSFTCGPCPGGFNGSGYTTCIAQCGNGVCEPGLGEHCVSCPLDCTISPCGQCGDGRCDAPSETCSTCNEDCGTCKTTKCPGSNDCSHHGTCVSGLCECTGPWGGPSCNHDNSEVTLNVTSNDPGFTVTSTSDPNTITFTITFSEIREIDQGNNIISTIDLATRNYTFSPLNNTQNNTSPSNVACDNCDLSYYVHTSGGAKNRQYVSNNKLDNNATIEFMIWQFVEDDTLVTFANKETHFAANTIKLAVQIRNWPFRALQHSLALVMDSDINSKSSPCVGKGEDENRNLKWFTLYVDGVTLYGQFLNRTILDGQFRQVDFKLDGEKSVIAILPHFWVNAVVDPSFSVLLGAEDTSCQSNHKKSNTRLIAIVVPICVVVVVAVVVAILLLPRIRSYISIKLSRRKLDEETPHKKEVEIEKIDSMEVNTTSGKYKLHL